MDGKLLKSIWQLMIWDAFSHHMLKKSSMLLHQLIINGGMSCSFHLIDQNKNQSKKSTLSKITSDFTQ
jgi:hypothetical protein